MNPCCRKPQTVGSVLRWFAVCLAVFTLPDKGHAMVAAERVFTDPQVIALANAARDGNVDRIAALIRAGANVRAVGEKGFTLPHFALYARQNAPQVMVALLKAGADPVSMLADGENVPTYAVERDNADPEVVKVLLDNGIDPNWRPPASNIFNETSLLQSAIGGHNLPVIKLLVQRGADINYVHPVSGSALHYALNGSDFFMAAFLVESGIDLSLKNMTSPRIKNPLAVSRTAIEKFCRFQGGKRGANPLPRIAEGWAAFTTALAKRGVTMPCGL